MKGDGAGRVFYEIVRAAARRDHHVTLFAEKIDDDLRDLQSVSTVRIPTDRIPTQLARTFAFSSKSTGRIRKSLERPDVLQSNGFATSARADVVAAHFVLDAWLRTCVSRENGVGSFRGAYQELLARVVSRSETRAFRKARAVVAVSHRVGDELAAIGVARKRIRVIPNAVDTEQFAPRDVDRERLGLPAGVPLVLFAGDIATPRKNLDVVLGALALRPSLHLAIVGGGQSKRHRYEKEIDALGLRSRIHMLGLRHGDYAEIVCAADAFVLPSHYEPFGLVVLEAMASGVPTIVSREVGASEAIRPGSGIVLEDRNDPKCLAAAFDRIFEDPEEARRMGAAGRAVALEHTWVGAANRYVDLYEELAAAPEIP